MGIADIAHKVSSVTLVAFSFGSLFWFGFALKDFLKHAKAKYAVVPGAASTAVVVTAAPTPLK